MFSEQPLRHRGGERGAARAHKDDDSARTPAGTSRRGRGRRRGAAAVGSCARGRLRAFSIPRGQRRDAVAAAPPGGDGGSVGHFVGQVAVRRAVLGQRLRPVRAPRRSGVVVAGPADRGLPGGLLRHVRPRRLGDGTAPGGHRRRLPSCGDGTARRHPRTSARRVGRHGPGERG